MEDCLSIVIGHVHVFAFRLFTYIDFEVRMCAHCQEFV